MADDTLRDIRSAVSHEAHCVLLAEERATGRSLSCQVRDLVEAYAKERVHAANVLQNLLRSNEPHAATNGDGRK